jgi:hypothetical protein
MNRLLSHLRANIVAYLALFVALGGTSYAAVRLPADSVGTKQLKNGSVTPIKLGSGTGAYVWGWAKISPSGQLYAVSPRGGRLTSWDAAIATGQLTWPALSSKCFAEATGDDGFVDAWLTPGPGRSAQVLFHTYSPSGQPTTQYAFLTILCPRP